MIVTAGPRSASGHPHRHDSGVLLPGASSTNRLTQRPNVQRRRAASAWRGRERRAGNGKPKQNGRIGRVLPSSDPN
jgi:hypothetical protein